MPFLTRTSVSTGSKPESDLSREGILPFLNFIYGDVRNPSGSESNEDEAGLEGGCGHRPARGGSGRHTWGGRDFRREGCGDLSERADLQGFQGGFPLNRRRVAVPGRRDRHVRVVRGRRDRAYGAFPRKVPVLIPGRDPDRDRRLRPSGRDVQV